MRKGILLLLISLIPVVLVGILIVQETRFPPDADRALAEYLTIKGGAAVLHIERAKTPWNFVSALSETSYGRGIHFRADVVFGGSGGYLPVYYPATDLWCVQIEDGAGMKKIVFVALHDSLYNAEWLVHEGHHILLADRAQTLETLECALPQP
ncbi:MAG: hypothetical protein GY792_24350 [Gammaproteobacteria bacterium]|nr:hypothetical protein [Gammaproteobacteria bacterium]